MRNTVVFVGSVFNYAKMVGVPRVLYETLLAIDADSTWIGKLEIILVMPYDFEIDLKNIKKEIYNPRKRKITKLGIEAWNQIDLKRFVKKKNAILVDVTSECMWFNKDITFIHDCQLEHFRDNYISGWYSGIINYIKRTRRKLVAKKTKLILTISEYTKKDIENTFSVDSKKIIVVPLGWQHFERIQPDESVYDDFPVLRQKSFFLSLGSGYKHKNIKWVISAANYNPQYLFAVTGDMNVAVYSDQVMKMIPNNVVFLGFISDEKVKALMKDCRAFIQPSFSEGFGLPPLEALSCGSQIILSTATCLPEIYGETASYIEPNDYNDIDLDKILEKKIDSYFIEEILNKYNWTKTAESLMSCIRLLEN